MTATLFKKILCILLKTHKFSQ